MAVHLRAQAGKEANIGAAAVAKGADCLVLDVEGQYEGKYTQASYFMSSLRSLIGPGLSDRARQLPLRGLPPGPSLFGLPRSRWGSVQHPAALLEGHRDHRRHRLHPHLGVEQDLRPADRPARAGVQPPEGGPDQAVPRPRPCHTASTASAGGTGRRPASVSGRRSASPSRPPPWGRTRAIRSCTSGPRVTSWPGPSSCSPAAATAVPVSGYFQSSTQTSGLRVPASMGCRRPGISTCRRGSPPRCRTSRWPCAGGPPGGRVAAGGSSGPASR